jgi:ketosteroid isomerase-like protein
MKMPNRTSFTFTLVTLTVAMVLPCSAQPSDTEKKILDLEEKMNATYAANDLPAYFAYYASDFTQWLPEGRTDLPQYEKEWTAFIHSGGKVEMAQTSDMHLQVSPGGDVVVASYLLHVKTRSPKGALSDENFQESDVWFKRHGEWKMVHLHYSPERKEKAAATATSG